MDPTDLTLDATGSIYVTEATGGALSSPASVIAVDAGIASQVSFLDNLSVPLGIGVDETGAMLLVANALPASVVGVDEFGTQTVVSSSGLLRETVGIAVSPFGVFVADRGDGIRPPSIVQIGASGAQFEISAAGWLTPGRTRGSRRHAGPRARRARSARLRPRDPRVPESARAGWRRCEAWVRSR